MAMRKLYAMEDQSPQFEANYEDAFEEARTSVIDQLKVS